ncbi:CDP-glycerol glycerophosphotransferase family protein [Vibrio breoganii]|uniref:CDP-glycerol glycerophosphotransferase family protein n=1 Tax=Vibrio breoganii TaxID=553239 RepID=UPI000C86290E|nr:CDP-glycerol glycerophosphotransferase family protein [Vibrio breoganii]PMK56610.1 hypothetical protein BCT98_09400 [Vibrio breoganii]
MKKLLFSFIEYVFHILNCLLPKLDQFVVFCGYPDYDDTLKGMLPYLPSNAIILVKDLKQPPPWVPQSLKLVKKNTLKGILCVFFAKKIYYTHGLFSFFRLLPEERQLVVNLWHGMPLKNIGYLDGKGDVPKSHYLLSTSDQFQLIMATAFNMPLSRVIVSGLPRNDLLLTNFSNSFTDSFFLKYSRVHVWLPTYRKSSVGDIRSDGSSNSVFGIDNFCPEKLNRLLVERNEFVIMKPHPMAVIENEAPIFSNILIINESWLYEHSLTLYELLSSSYSLWSDYSSVAVDYLLLERPILLIMSDFESYKNTRGLTSMADEIPATKVYNEKELLEAVKNLNVNGIEIEKFHKHRTFINDNI